MPTKFAVHTPTTTYIITAESPAAARAIVAKKHPGIRITKVKIWRA